MDINFNKDEKDKYLYVPMYFRQFCENLYDYTPPNSCNIPRIINRFNSRDIVTTIPKGTNGNKKNQYSYNGQRMIPIPLKRGPKITNEYEKEVLLEAFIGEKLQFRKDKYRYDERNMGYKSGNNPYYGLEPNYPDLFESKVNSIVIGTNELLKYFGVYKGIRPHEFKSDKELYNNLLLYKVELRTINDSLSFIRQQIDRFLLRNDNITYSSNALLLIDTKYGGAAQRIDDFLDIELNDYNWENLIDRLIDDKRVEYTTTDTNTFGSKFERLQERQEEAKQKINKFTIFNNEIINESFTQPRLKEALFDKFKKPFPRNMYIVPAKEIKIIRHGVYERLLKIDKYYPNGEEIDKARIIINSVVVNKLKENITEWCINEKTNDRALRFEYIIDNCIKI